MHYEWIKSKWRTYNTAVSPAKQQGIAASYHHWPWAWQHGARMPLPVPPVSLRLLQAHGLSISWGMCVCLSIYIYLHPSTPFYVCTHSLSCNDSLPLRRAVPDGWISHALYNFPWMIPEMFAAVMVPKSTFIRTLIYLVYGVHLWNVLHRDTTPWMKDTFCKQQFQINSTPPHTHLFFP